MITGMPLFERTSFLEIWVDGRKYDYDITLHVDGRITRRRKELSKPFADGHTPVAPPELEELLNECPEIIVIGNGQAGAMPVPEETRKLATEKGVELIVVRTPEALDILNRLLREGRRVAAILHITC